MTSFDENGNYFAFHKQNPMHGTSAGTPGRVRGVSCPRSSRRQSLPKTKEIANSETAGAAAKAKRTVNLELQEFELSEFTPGFPSLEYPASSRPFSSCSYTSGSLFKFTAES